MAIASAVRILQVSSVFVVFVLLPTAVRSDAVLSSIFRYIYNNENLCGDQFADPSWLPAHENCEIECDVTSEICQITATSAMRSQRCHTLPVECSNNLKTLIANDPEGTVPTSTRNLTRHLAVLDHSPPPGSFEEPTRSPLKIQRLRQWERPAPPPRASAPTSKAFVTAAPPEEPPSPGVPPRQRPKWPGPAPLAELPDFLGQSAASWASSPGQLVAPPGRDHSSIPALIVPQPPSEDAEPPALPPLPPAEPPPLHPIGDLMTGPLPPVPESSAPSPPWPPPAAPAARPPPATQGTPLWNSPRQRVRTTQKIDDTQQTNFMNMMLERPLIPPPSTPNPEEENIEMNEIFDTSSNPFDSTFAISSTQAPTALAAAGGGGQWFLPPSERNGAGAVSVRPMVEVAPARTTSSEDHVHVFGPPYSPEMTHVGGDPTYPAPPLPPSDIPYSSPNMSPLSPTNPYTVRDGEENPTVDPSVFSTTYGRYGRKRGDPWTWRELAGKLKRKPLYSLDNGEVFDRSIRCCQWALDGLCDRSWQRIRQLCPKSCGTVVCSSSDGALSCNRAIDVDVIDCYERRRFRAYGTTSTGVQRAPHPTSHLADDPSQQGARPVGHRQAPAMKFAKGWVNDATPVDASGQARRLGISGGYRSAYTIEEEIKAYRLRHGFRS